MKTPRRIKPLTAARGRHRKQIRAAMREVHVVPTPGGYWEVRTLGPKGPERVRKKFRSKEAAVQEAKKLCSTGLLGVRLHSKPPERDPRDQPSDDRGERS
jgi:hypothetical protein